MIFSRKLLVLLLRVRTSLLTKSVRFHNKSSVILHSFLASTSLPLLLFLSFNLRSLTLNLTSSQFSVNSDSGTFGQFFERFDGSTVDRERQVVGGFGLGNEVEEFSFIGDGDVGQLGGALDEELHFWICFRTLFDFFSVSST